MRFCDFWRGLLGVLWVGAIVLGQPDVALAAIHRYPEGLNQVMWRSLQTLRDEDNTAWQIVVYKCLQSDQMVCLNLRLVGFPGVTKLARQPLLISTGSGQVWTVPTVTTVPLPETAGEYDLQTVISELRGNPPLKLSLPGENRSIQLVVPPFVVQEWQTVAQKA